jgi:hypothetical protein
MLNQVAGFGPNSGELAQVDPTTQSLHVSLRPIDWIPAFGGVTGGHYCISANNGSTAMSAGIADAAQVFQVRWADPSKFMFVKRVVVQASTGTGFAATSQGCPLDLILGHNSTANGSGGNAVSISSISNRLRNTMAPSAFATSGEIRMASIGAMTAATGQTLEPTPIGICAGAPNATLQQSGQMILWETEDMGDHPLVLGPGDTLVIRANKPAATGTWFFVVTMEWFEAVSF